MPAPRFDYRIGFWRNLHHTLYAMSTSHPAAGKVRKIKVRPADIASLERLNPEERAIWSDTIAFYAANLVRRNLLFDDEMVAVGEALSMAGSDPRLDEAIPADLRQRLMQAAPIYRKYWWPEHQNVSAQWKEAVEPLLALHGPMLAARMSELYQVPWPATPVETNLSVYANSAGAYTIVKPTRITVATGDSTYAGHAALEMLLHETGHGMVDPLRAQLELASKAAANRPGANMDAVRRDLWHELLFYITGEIVADAVPGYVPYADKNELWRFAWPGPDRQAIERHLPPYIEGKTTLESALAGLTRELAATPAETGYQYHGRGRYRAAGNQDRCSRRIAISLAPVILRAGTKLFDDFERHIHLEPIKVVDTPLATHLRYRVITQESS